MLKRFYLLSVLLLTLSPVVYAEGELEENYVLRDFATGLSHPWGLAFLPDGRILLSELSGSFRILEADGRVGDPLTGVPEVVFDRQGGLSDVVLSPDFANDKRIYFSYSAKDPDQNNSTTLFVTRARLSSDALTDLEVIFKAKAPRKAAVHFGARMVFMPDGTLLISSGDAFDHREKAQYLNNHYGKLVRINPDGSVPPDNPFVNTPDALPEIWSYGHRNMQGLIVTSDGVIYENEHGPRGGDELNIIHKGANYGWPLICHCLDYSFAVLTPFTEAEGLEQPLKYWRPSIAPSGMVYYESDVFPLWQDSFFVSGLVPGDVRRVYRDGDNYEEEVLFTEVGERIRNVYETPDGNLLIMTDGPKGRLITVEPEEKPSRG